MTTAHGNRQFAALGSREYASLGSREQDMTFEMLFAYEQASLKHYCPFPLIT